MPPIYHPALFFRKFNLLQCLESHACPKDLGRAD